jgi:8-oxo-dGTP diphosphatase
MRRSPNKSTTLNNSDAGQHSYCYKYPRPAVTADIVLFLTAGDELQVLLIKRAHDPSKGKWALPGGFVDENEPLKHAALRELEEETGVKRVSLEQVAAFGDPGRDPRGHTVSIAFAGVLRSNRNVKAGDDAAQAEWHPALHPPPLAFDHNKILRAALEHVFGKDFRKVLRSEKAIRPRRTR